MTRERLILARARTGNGSISVCGDDRLSIFVQEQMLNAEWACPPEADEQVATQVPSCAQYGDEPQSMFAQDCAREMEEILSHKDIMGQIPQKTKFRLIKRILNRLMRLTNRHQEVVNNAVYRVLGVIIGTLEWVKNGLLMTDRKANIALDQLRELQQKNAELQEQLNRTTYRIELQAREMQDLAETLQKYQSQLMHTEDVVTTLGSKVSAVSDSLIKLDAANQRTHAWIGEMSAERKAGQDRAERHETAMTRTIGAVARDLVRTKWQMRDMLEAEHGDENRELHCGICGYHAPLSSFETKEADCIFAGGHLKRFVCPKCGCIFGPTKFSDQTESEFDDDYTVHYAGFHEGDSTDKELYAFHMLKPSKTGIYLDYGCGSWSHTITQLRAEGYNVYGYDPYAADVDDSYVISDKEQLALMRFDGIFSNDLLEHLSDPIHELQFMKLLLKSRESKMAHCTGCYNYKYEYTRFHMFFFTGKSLDVLAERAGLSVLERSREPKTGDPCCLFGVTDGQIDLTKKLRCTGMKNYENGVLAKPGEVIFGPYIALPAGEYVFSVQATVPADRRNEICRMTSMHGQRVLQTFHIYPGNNQLCFILSAAEPDIELVMENHSASEVLSVSRLTLEANALAMEAAEGDGK